MVWFRKWSNYILDLMMDESFSAESIAESELSSQTLCYRQRLEKTTGGEVILMEWSPTMDLLAAALADHSVRF